jgi:GNAT superfamily N-acetyltransferase
LFIKSSASSECSDILVEMRVRWARVQDARAIAEVHVASWLGGYRGRIPDAVLDRLSVDEREEQWRRWLGDPARGSRTLVAGRERVEGFCSVAMPARSPKEGAGVAEIPAFYVAPGSWRGGVGTALMRRALDEMGGAGYTEALVWVLDGNDHAVAFYEASGWRLDGERDEWTPQVEGAEPLPAVSLRIDLRARRY